MKLHELKKNIVYIGEDNEEYIIGNNRLMFRYTKEDIFALNRLTQDFTEKKEPLTFERIRKECVSGKHLLVDKNGERLFLAFNRSGQLVTDCNDGEASIAWIEDEIISWEIKPYETT